MTVQLDPLIGGLVHTSSSASADTATAIRATLDEVDAASAAFTYVFFSPKHDPAIVARELHRTVGGRGIAGSTAGEIGPRGFAHGSIVALALHGSHVRASARIVPRLSDFSLLRVSTLAGELAEDLGHSVETLDPSRHMWLLSLDGLSGREDFFTPFFMTYAPRLPLVGGSFADEEAFSCVSLAHGGHLHHGAGAVILLEYDRPFEVIHHTHLEFTEHWFEVTDTQRGGRVLVGLDGRPAAEVYAEALGVAPRDLTLEITGSAAFGFRFKGRPFPCSVMRADAKHLFLAYSVQRGDRLNLLHADGLVEKSSSAIADAIADLRAANGTPQALLAFHCLGRYLEARRLGVIEQLYGAMHQVPLLGLNTYGEQFGSRHMNHSLCGVLFG